MQGASPSEVTHLPSSFSFTVRRQQRVPKSLAAPLPPFPIRPTSLRAPLLANVEIGIDLEGPACHAHERPRGRLRGHRVSPALRESFRRHQRILREWILAQP